MNHREETKAPFADHTSKHDKRQSGRTDAAHTQLEIRSGGETLEDGLREWVFERIGRQLGKYAPQIERIQVRFGDENGPKGGEDKCCLVHVILSKLPPVVVESRGETQRAAFDLAAGRAERATRRNMEKHGFSTHHHQHARNGRAEPEELAPEADAEALDAADGPGPDSMLGRRGAPLAAVALGSDAPDDGADHTVTRNMKENTSGMTYGLEDSTTGKPSRKSTRGSANHIKHGNPLTQRTKAAVQGPKETAIRASVQKR